MKTNVKTIAVTLFAISTVLWSCKKEPIEHLTGMVQEIKQPTPEAVQPTDIVDVETISQAIDLSQGQWRITNYEEEVIVKPAPLSYLDDYTIVFRDFNIVLAEKDGKVVTGKWSRFTKKNVNYLILDFQVGPLSLITNQWMINKESNTSVFLQATKDYKPVFMNLSKINNVEVVTDKVD